MSSWKNWKYIFAFQDSASDLRVKTKLDQGQNPKVEQNNLVLIGLLKPTFKLDLFQIGSEIVFHSVKSDSNLQSSYLLNPLKLNPSQFSSSKVEDSVAIIWSGLVMSF